MLSYRVNYLLQKLIYRYSFKKPPLLYKYPEANSLTVKNIALELIKNESFYIKVCHIMNLMCLPPPF
jgi:hypothetical protein